MNYSIFDLLREFLQFSGDQHRPEILGTLLSFLFMGMMALSKFIFPLLRLFVPTKPASLQRTCVELVIAVALTCALWFVPILSVINISISQFLVIAGATFVATAIAMIKVLQLIGTLLKLGLAHTAAAVIPHREVAAPITTYQQPAAPLIATGPVRSKPRLSQIIEAGFNNGAIVPFIAVGAFGIGAAVTYVIFGPTAGFIAGISGPPVDTSLLAQTSAGAAESPPDIFGGMRHSAARLACTLGVFGLVLLGVSRYAARRGLHYNGDPWAALAQSVRPKRKEPNAWQALDQAVRRHQQR